MRSLRRLAPAVLGLALLATATVGCEWPEGTRYVHEVFDQVEVTRDVVYRTTTDSTGQQVELKADIYRPAGDTATDRPAVIWGFGGAWQAGDKNQLSAYATDSAERGYVGITIEYRIRPGGGPLLDMAGDAYEDTVASVQWVKDHAAEYGVDPDAVVVAGYSAGAINAMNVAFWPGERGPVEESGAAGAVAIAGFTFGVQEQGDPPVLMFQGTADSIVNPDTARSTCDNTLAVDNHCTYVPVEGGDHFIAFSQIEMIQDTTAEWIFEQVLYPMGYRADEAAAA